MRKAMFDWFVVGFLFLFLITFITFVQARGTTLTGKVIGLTGLAPACESFSNFERVPLGTKALNLCANQTHSIDFFVLQSDDARINCNGSTIQGRGGAAFIPSYPSARVTLRNCLLAGFDGLYQNSNPVDVRVE